MKTNGWILSTCSSFRGLLVAPFSAQHDLHDLPELIYQTRMRFSRAPHPCMVHKLSDLAYNLCAFKARDHYDQVISSCCSSMQSLSWLKSEAWSSNSFNVDVNFQCENCRYNRSRLRTAIEARKKPLCTTVQAKLSEGEETWVEQCWIERKGQIEALLLKKNRNGEPSNGKCLYSCRSP